MKTHRTDRESFVKSCCAALYEGKGAAMLLGESLHPGGLALTERLGQLLNLGPRTCILDVASGNGASAVYLAKRFGCAVTAVDYSGKNVTLGTNKAAAAGLRGQACFVLADGEQLPVQDSSFDAVICECAYCTFPDKAAAVAEFARVLRPGGYLGVTDVTTSGRPLPDTLEALLAWIACLAGAQRVEEYERQFTEGGFQMSAMEDHSDSLKALVRELRTKLLGLDLLAKLGNVAGLAEALAESKQLGKYAADAVESGLLGYHLFIGEKPLGRS
ncbi:MAG: class I SAM-dependent methyltransferase [Chloroflexi bacterium]|nr:class I SAM-dependent methyltransferase [Chloroflexota bacterium]